MLWRECLRPAGDTANSITTDASGNAVFNNHSFIIRYETFDDHKAYVLTIDQEEDYGQSLEVEFESFEVNQID